MLTHHVHVSMGMVAPPALAIGLSGLIGYVPPLLAALASALAIACYAMQLYQGFKKDK